MPNDTGIWFLGGRLKACNVWLRSANCSNANNVGNVNSSGNVNNNNANGGNRCAPDCVIENGQKGCGIAMALQQYDTRSRIPECESTEQRDLDGRILRDGRPICGVCKEDVIGFDALWESMMKCKRGVMWKDSAAHYVLNGVEETAKLSEQLHDGTYKPRATKTFMVTNPKPREIISISFRDRVYQRSLNDNVVYPVMSRSFVYDNAACQKDKGTDFARRRLKCHMQRQYRRSGTGFHVLQIDISGYYPNMSHRITEEMFGEKLPEWAYGVVLDVLNTQYPGEYGYNPGSQMIQIAGISFLDKLDHFIKERLRIKGYVRYMDDLILIHSDREYLERCKDEIEEKLTELDMRFNPKKTRIYSVTDGIPFLGFDFKLADSGKVLMFVKSANVKQAKRRLRRMVNLAKKGYRDKAMVDMCYRCYRDHISKGDSVKLLERMDAYYKSLWRAS